MRKARSIDSSTLKCSEIKQNNRKMNRLTQKYYHCSLYYTALESHKIEQSNFTKYSMKDMHRMGLLQLQTKTCSESSTSSATWHHMT